MKLPFEKECQVLNMGSLVIDKCQHEFFELVESVYNAINITGIVASISSKQS